MATPGKKQTDLNDKAPSMKVPAAGFLASGSLDWVKSFGIALLVALSIRWAFFEPFRIPSGSMEPTFMGDPHIFKGDRVWVNKFVYGLRYPLNGVRLPLLGTRLDYAKDRIWRREKPQRWDIVVFKAVQKNAMHTTLVKRVVGLPGERIHIADGKVYVNGVPLELPPGMPPVYYTSPSPYGYDSQMKYGILPQEEYSLIPEDSYLLLGDNSAQSADGRYFGWVPYERILGRVACIWWPIPHWRDFTGFSQTWWWQLLVAVTSLLLVVRLLFGRSWRHHQDGRVNHLYINRWAYGVPIPFTPYHAWMFKKPRRGERVLYRTPKTKMAPSHLSYGIVAACEGERVFLDAGALQVNGEPPQEKALACRAYLPGEQTGPYARSKGKEYSQVPEGHVFILTEDYDTGESLDSRTLGWVPLGNLIGRAAAVWWPPHRISTRL